MSSGVENQSDYLMLPIFKIDILEIIKDGIGNCQVNKAMMEIFARDRDHAAKVLEALNAYHYWKVLGDLKETGTSEAVPFPGVRLGQTRSIFKGRFHDKLIAALMQKIESKS